MVGTELSRLQASAESTLAKTKSISTEPKPKNQESMYIVDLSNEITSNSEQPTKESTIYTIDLESDEIESSFEEPSPFEDSKHSRINEELVFISC